VIRKRYEFKTLQKPGTPPLAQVTGEGTLTFDQKLGVPVKMEYKATVVRSANNVSLTIPVSLTWNRVDQKTLDEAKAKALAAKAAAPPSTSAPASGTKPAAGAAATKPVAAAPAGKPPTIQDVDQQLEQLKRATNFSQKYIVVSALSRMEAIDERRANVTKAVEPLMRDSNSGLRDAAIRTMGVWGTKENVPALLEMLDQLDNGIRRATMEALARIPDERSAKALAKLVIDESSRNNAAAALKKMGPVAEAAVITLLASDDHQVRYQACHILAEIGGKKSIAAISKRLKTDKHNWSRTAAEIALRKLNGK
jgi:HEAT repeat protein